MQYYLQKSGKNAQQIKNIPEIDEENYIDLTLECTLNQIGLMFHTYTNPFIALENIKLGPHRHGYTRFQE